MKIIATFSVMILTLTGCGCAKQSANTGKIQDCPELMIDNRMPLIVDDEAKKPAVPRKYYIYKGERREIAEFDTVWVKKNCNVEVQTVY